MPATVFLTTAIDYTNGAPHLGHAYEKVLADVIARYHRLKGEEVFFLTGVDQHGQKVQQSAEREGVPPQQFADRITQLFRDLWVKLGVEYDGWAATTAPLHQRCVQAILQRLNDEGQIYKKAEGGYYSIRQEQFLTDKERGADGEFGPEWGEVEFREEENYFFRLAQHREWLLAQLEARPELITPDFRRAELRNAAEKLTGDLCISRPKSRLSWGIELPFDREFVTFVWFDALINYISFAGYEAEAGSGLPDFRRVWPPRAHIIGKDIMMPAHGIYWPIMLHALGFADADIPPLLVHGFWNMGGLKMSKSLGNSADPVVLADRYGAEALRYYLMSDIATGRDADFSEERLVMRYNTELANSLGNLLNRTLNMAGRFRGGQLHPTERRLHEEEPSPAQAETTAGETGDTAGARGLGLRELLDRLPGLYTEPMEAFQIHQALPVHLVDCCNRLIDKTAPWTLAKQEKAGDAEAGPLLDAVLYHLAESLRIAAILLSPVLPQAAHGIFDQLQWKTEKAGQQSRFSLAEAKWGVLPEGHQLGAGIPLFPRLELAAAV